MIAADSSAPILKLLGQIAGIGGLALGVFLLVFQNIIGIKKLFPQLTQDHAFRLLRLMVISCFVVTLLGLLTYIAGEHWLREKMSVDSHNSSEATNPTTSAPSSPTPYRSPSPAPFNNKQLDNREHSSTQNIAPRLAVSASNYVSTTSSRLKPNGTETACVSINVNGECIKYEYPVRFRFLKSETTQPYRVWTFIPSSFPPRKNVLTKFMCDITPSPDNNGVAYLFAVEATLEMPNEKCDPVDYCRSVSPHVRLEKETQLGDSGKVHVDLRIACPLGPCACPNGVLSLTVQK